MIQHEDFCYLQDVHYTTASDDKRICIIYNTSLTTTSCVIALFLCDNIIQPILHLEGIGFIAMHGTETSCSTSSHIGTFGTPVFPATRFMKQTQRLVDLLKKHY
jgi:hypothetical protein